MYIYMIIYICNLAILQWRYITVAIKIVIAPPTKVQIDIVDTSTFQRQDDPSEITWNFLDHALADGENGQMLMMVNDG